MERTTFKSGADREKIPRLRKKIDDREQEGWQHNRIADRLVKDEPVEVKVKLVKARTVKIKPVKVKPGVDSLVKVKVHRPVDGAVVAVETTVSGDVAATTASVTGAREEEERATGIADMAPHQVRVGAPLVPPPGLKSSTLQPGATHLIFSALPVQ